MGCCVCVGEAKAGVIESWGRFSRVAHPGCTCINCCTESLIGELSVRIEQHALAVETRSKDNVFVNIKLAIQLKVAKSSADFPSVEDKKSKKKKKEDLDSDEEELLETASNDRKQLMNLSREDIIYRAYYDLDKPVNQILALVEEYFRFHGMEYTLDEMFAAKNEMTHDLLNVLNIKMNQHGYVIVNVLVMDIEPDHKVKDAMNDIIASEKEKRAQQSRAEAEKITKILAAEAEAKTRELAGEGIANARKAIISGLQESVENFQTALPNSNPSEILTTVLMTQYLDTIKEAAANGKNTFILPSSPGQVTAIEEQLRMAILTTQKH